MMLRAAVRTSRALFNVAKRHLMDLPGSKTLKINVGNSEISLHSGGAMPLTDSAVVAARGGAVVMATVVSARESEPRYDDFVPLTVDYRSKTAAAGVISVRSTRRDGKIFRVESSKLRPPSDAEILAARAIDRVIRPLIPKGYPNETQVVITVQANDGIGDCLVLGMQAAGAALSLSDVPFHGTFGVVRVAKVEGDLVVQPTMQELGSSDIDLLYAGAGNRVLMLESCAGEYSDDDMEAALRFANTNASQIVSKLQKWVDKNGAQKRDWEKLQLSEDMVARVSGRFLAEATELFSGTKTGKGLDKAAFGLEQDRIMAGSRELAIEMGASEDAAAAIAEHAFEQAFRKAILELKAKRADGRDADELRSLVAQSNVMAFPHGSSLFCRGLTHVLGHVTLGAPRSALNSRMALRSGKYSNEWTFLHYDFPPYATNEIGKIGLLGRRGIGHGALAERAILPVMPPRDEFGVCVDFPYAARINAEVLASNGSSSMASACAASLALMDAGVPLTNQVCGLSVGLVSNFADGECKLSRASRKTPKPKDARDLAKSLGAFQLLSDIQGLEDHYGEMDFKIAGSRDGITAMQLDVKLPHGVPLDVLLHSIRTHARDGRHKILDVMESSIARPRQSIKDHVPVVEVIQFHPDKENRLRGNANSVKNSLENRLGVKVDIRPYGVAYISSDADSIVHGAGTDFDRQAANEAVHVAADVVRDIVMEMEVGQKHTGTVLEVHEFGAVVEVRRGHEGFLHISEVTQGPPPRPMREMLAPGQKIKVLVMEVDPVMDSLRLSRKQALSPKEAQSDNLFADTTATPKDSSGEPLQKLESFLERLPEPPSAERMLAVRRRYEQGGGSGRKDKAKPMKHGQ